MEKKIAEKRAVGSIKNEEKIVEEREKNKEVKGVKN